MNETERQIVAWLRKQIVERELSAMTRHELIILTYELESGEHRETGDDATCQDEPALCDLCHGGPCRGEHRETGDAVGS